MAIKINLPRIYGGAVYRKVFEWFSDSDGVQTPMDFSLYDGKIQLRNLAGGAVLAEWSTTNGYLKLVANRTEIDVLASVTDDYVFEEAEYDLLIWPKGHPELAELMIHGSVEYERTITVVS